MSIVIVLWHSGLRDQKLMRLSSSRSSFQIWLFHTKGKFDRYNMLLGEWIRKQLVVVPTKNKSIREFLLNSCITINKLKVRIHKHIYTHVSTHKHTEKALRCQNVYCLKVQIHKKDVIKIVHVESLLNRVLGVLACFRASSIDKWGFRAKNLKNKRTKFLNLLILGHLKNYFIEALNKFLICFEINGLKNLKLTILCFFPGTPTYLYYSTSSKKHFLLLKHHEFT